VSRGASLAGGYARGYGCLPLLRKAVSNHNPKRATSTPARAPCNHRFDRDASLEVLRPEVATKDEYKTARVIGQLEPAQDPHQIVNLAPGGGPAGFKVLLHTQTSKESQDDTG
jgi:hypothetical protein